MSSPTRATVILFKYRWLIYELVLRDLRLRYRGSILGFAWTLLNPLLFLAVYTLVFSVYLRVHIPNFTLFLFAGFVPWTWLSTAVSLGTSSIIDGRMYVGKSLFPTEVLVVVPVLSAGINFLLSMPFIFGLAFISRIDLGWAWLTLPIVVVIELLLIQALVLLIATLNVFYRDVQQLVVYALTLGFFMTPIFYTRAMVPAHYRFLVDWNPVAPIIFAFQDVFYKGVSPNLESLIFPLAFGAVMLAIAYGYFARYREAFSQYL